MVKKLGRWVSFELATPECDMAAVPGDGMSSSYKSEGQFYPRWRLSVCGKGLGLRKPEHWDQPPRKLPVAFSPGYGDMSGSRGRVATPAGAGSRSVQLGQATPG